MRLTLAKVTNRPRKPTAATAHARSVCPGGGASIQKSRMSLTSRGRTYPQTAISMGGNSTRSIFPMTPVSQRICMDCMLQWICSYFQITQRICCRYSALCEKSARCIGDDRTVWTKKALISMSRYSQFSLYICTSYVQTSYLATLVASYLVGRSQTYECWVPPNSLVPRFSSLPPLSLDTQGRRKQKCCGQAHSLQQ